MRKPYFSQWHPTETDIMPTAFARFCVSQNLRPTPELWRAYQKHRERHQAEDYAAFGQSLQRARDLAAANLDKWGNPFANAKKGQDYELIFTLPECIVRYHLKGIEQSGLFWEKIGERSGKISGIPKTAGEHELTLECIWQGWQRGLPILIKRLKFLVNPDPRDLWRNLPCDPNLEYLRPDTQFELLQTKDALLAGASIRGHSHAHSGLPRDDAFALRSANGWHILAVADGAGSAAYSRRGAELACATSVAVCARELGPQLDALFAGISPSQPKESWQGEARKLAYGALAQAAFEAHKAIRQQATEAEREARTYATTLLLCVAKKYAAGWAVLAFQIGDGAMALLAPEATCLLCKADEGEYSGQTRFLTMGELFEPHELMRRLRVLFVEKLTGLLLLTDGVSDPRFGTDLNLRNPANWLRLWEEVEPLARGENQEAALLRWLDFWERGNHDDRTLALLSAQR